MPCSPKSTEKDLRCQIKFKNDHMKQSTTRRDFVKKLAIGSSIALSPNLLFGKSNIADEIPLTDYHVHLHSNFTIEEAVANFKSLDMQFGIVEHPGRQANIVDDNSLLG